MTRKIFVLDTNVLLHDPRAIEKFEENDVVLPIHVIEELDHFKKEMSELGRNARTVTRALDELRTCCDGTLEEGARLASGGRLRVHVPSDVFARRGSDSAAMDTSILEAAIRERDANPSIRTVFVTMDTNLRIRADALGLRAETYEGGQVDLDELESGITELFVDGEAVSALGQRSELTLEALDLGAVRLRSNAGVVLRDLASSSHSALGRVSADRRRIRPLRVPREGISGVKPRNVEQHFALDLLLDDSIHLVTLVGRAGTGKTLLALAAGLRRVIEDGSYARLLVSRPIFPLGRDVGYLPGDLEAKLNPWMQPIFDNLDHILDAGRTRMNGGRNHEELMASGMIQIEPLTYIRGRSLPNRFLIVDESQNLTPHEVKTILTRCGESTKIVLTGDPHQIDNPYVDAASNGLTMVAERFADEPLAGHVTLHRGERSDLADRAAQLL